jgi:hypothetical protein
MKSTTVQKTVRQVRRTFLERIVTGDETWVHQYERENIAQTSLVAKKLKSQSSAGKIMLTRFLGYGRRDFGSFYSKGSRSLPQRFPYVWSNEEDFHPTKKSLTR